MRRKGFLRGFAGVEEVRLGFLWVGGDGSVG